jgi:single-strand DNA-binding protein
MSDINRVVLVGRLTRDPELRPLPAGGAVCGLRVACNSPEHANYFDVSIFGDLGEKVKRLLRKSSRVGLEGRLAWREWRNADDRRCQAVSIVADSVQFLDSPVVGSEPGEDENDGPLTKDIEGEHGE